MTLYAMVLPVWWLPERLIYILPNLDLKWRKGADTDHESYRETANLQIFMARNYRWRHTRDRISDPKEKLE